MKIKNTILAIILFLLSAHFLVSQPVDSINFAKLSQEQMVDTFLFLSRHYSSISQDKSFKYATDAMVLSENIDYTKGKLKAYLTMGENNILSGNYVTAMEYFFKSMSIAQNKHSLKDIAYTMNKIGRCYQYITDFESALNFYNDALNIYQGTRDEKGIIETLVNVAGCYGMRDNCEKGLKVYEEALEKALAIKDKNHLIIIYNGIGNCYTVMGDYEKSLLFYEKSWGIAAEVNDGKKMASLLSNIGNVYRILGETKKAIYYTEWAYNKADSIDYKDMMSTTLYNLSGIYLEKEDYNQSLKYVERARKVAEDLGYIVLRVRIWEQYVKLYQTLGNFDEANKYHTLLVKEQNEGQRINNAARIANLQVLYNLAGKQQRLQELERLSDSYKSRMKWFVFLFILSLAGIFILSVLFFHVKRSGEKQQAELMRKQNLQVSMQEQENKQINLLQEQIEAEREKYKMTIEKVGMEKQQVEMLLEQLTVEKQRKDIQLEQIVQEQKKLEEEIDTKNRELVSVAMQIQQKNELFLLLRNDIQKLKDHLSIPLINEMVKAIDHNIRMDKDWDIFLLHFKNVHTNFFDILQQNYPELTERDLKQCAYIRMGLSIKEVATLMNISTRAVEKARMKIKAKMNLEADVNLASHLQHILAS